MQLNIQFLSHSGHILSVQRLYVASGYCIR